MTCAPARRYTRRMKTGRRICNELGFDILLAGHQHMPVENLCLNGTYTCQPPDKAAAYIRMDVTVGDTITAESRLCQAVGAAAPRCGGVSCAYR